MCRTLLDTWTALPTGLDADCSIWKRYRFVHEITGFVPVWLQSQRDTTGSRLDSSKPARRRFVS